MRDQRQRPQKRNRRVKHTPSKQSPDFNKKVCAVAVGTVLSLGAAYPVFAAATASNENNSSPFSTSNLGVSTANTTGTTASTPNNQGGQATGGTTNPTTSGGAALPPAGVPNEGGVLNYDPSSSVIANAESCAQRRSDIVKETTEVAIETAGTTFDVDDFWTKVKDNGCLVSVENSISLANQITQLSGGSISSVIMSAVKSKIQEAGQQMLDNVLNKGCEVMLEASQNVYGPIDDLVKKYGVYSNPDYVGDELNGIVDGVVDNAIFNFDQKLDQIGKDILERDNNSSSGGGSGNTGGGLLPAPSDNPANSSGSTSLDEAEKEAAKSTVTDLAESRNFVEYPLFYRFSLSNPYSNSDTRGNKHTHLHSLNPYRPQGIEIGSVQVPNAGWYHASKDVVRLNTYPNSNTPACAYIAQISTINNEIKKMAQEAGIQDTSSTPVRPVNIRSSYWNPVNANINAAINNGYECAEAPVEITPNSNTPNSASTYAAPRSSQSAASNSRTQQAQVNNASPAIDYSQGQSTPMTNNSIQATPQTRQQQNGPDISLAAPPSSNNEATQYMQNRQNNNGAAPTPESSDTADSAASNSQSSNPFSRMKSFLTN